MLSVLAAHPSLATVTEPAAPLRIALATNEPSALVRTDPEFRRGATETAAALRELGHTVTEVSFPYPANPLPLLARWFGGTATDAAALDLRKLEPRIRTHARLDIIKASQRHAFCASSCGL